MKKFTALLLILGLTVSTCAFSEELKQVTSETIFYIKAVHSLPENALKDFSVFNTKENSAQMQEQLISFLKTCQPYNENININFFGFDATLNINSAGKVNGKCAYEFTGKVNKIPEQMTSASGMSGSDLMAFKPKVNCEFTQEQLDYIAESFNETLIEMKTDNSNISKVKAKEKLKNKIENDEKFRALFKDGDFCRVTSLTENNL